ncbi:MAG: ribonuclease P protein component [Bacteroidales bacterium OttesenSCG-928-I14]|jgi:ribonuclease P protein component|nr:ribonuclease P protein component [Bacteroidales bacterium OttesenSCG-928-I14]
MPLNFKQTFIKSERIFLKKDIDHLFKNGFSFDIYPFRIVYLENIIKENVIPVSILISVQKKYLKHAVERNKIKRLIRESYRLTKYKLLNYFAIRDKNLLLAIIYKSCKLYKFNQIQMLINKILNTLKEKLS